MDDTQRQENEARPMMHEVIDKVRKGYFRQANEIYGEDISKNKVAQEKFMAHLVHYEKNENTFNFVRQFSQPDWFAYIAPITYVHEFVHLSQKYFIDLYKPNEGGKTLFDIIAQKDFPSWKLSFGGYGGEGLSAKMYQALNAREFQDAFIDGVCFDTVEQLLQLNFKRGEYGKTLHTVVDAILVNLTDHEVIGTPNHKRLVAHANGFMDAVMSGDSLFNVEKLLTKHSWFFMSEENSLLSTAVVKSLMAGNMFSDHHLQALDDLIANGVFQPNLSLLSEGYRQAWENGHLSTLDIDSLQYRAYKKILEYDPATKNRLNQALGHNAGFFELVILDNVPAHYLNTKNMKKIPRLIEELTSLISLGIEPFCAQHDKQQLVQMVKIRGAQPLEMNRHDLANKNLAFSQYQQEVLHRWRDFVEHVTWYERPCQNPIKQLRL